MFFVDASGRIVFPASVRPTREARPERDHRRPTSVRAAVMAVAIVASAVFAALAALRTDSTTATSAPSPVAVSRGTSDPAMPDVLDFSTPASEWLLSLNHQERQP